MLAAMAMAAACSPVAAKETETEPEPKTVQASEAETERQENVVFRAETSETDADGNKTGGTEYVLYSGGRETTADFGKPPKETELTDLEYNEIMSLLHDSFLEAEDSPARGDEPEWKMSFVYEDKVLWEYNGGESGSYAVRKIAEILRGAG